MNNANVSVVMAVYNGERYLIESLNHIFNQTYPCLEIIIVNDGSTDSTKMILDEVKDNRLKVIHLAENGGAANALNIGIGAAKGEWIAIQDADDNSYPTRIEEQMKYLQERPELLGVGTLVKCISGDVDIPDEAYEDWTISRNYYITKEEIRKIIYWGCPLTHSSVMFSKKAFIEVGGYDPSYKIAYDYDLWLKLLEKGMLEKVPKVLLDYRIHRDSLSHKDGFATIHEIQVAASRSIFRAKSNGKRGRPKVIAIGSEKSCQTYGRDIAPKSGLEVIKFITTNFNRRVSAAARLVRKRKADAIVVLDNKERDTILRMLFVEGLKYNQNLYVLFNSLE